MQHFSPFSAVILSFSLATVGACVRQPEGAPPAASKAKPDAAPKPKGPQTRMIVVQRKCMGTACVVKAFHHDEPFVNAAIEKGLAEMDRLEALMTSWTDTSDVARINAAAGKEAVKVAPETLEVIQKGLWIAERSEGHFDITVGAFKGLWKFDQDNDGSIPPAAEVKKRQKLVNWKDVIVDGTNRTVKLRRVGQRVNLEGLAKGYSVDHAVKVIRAAGLKNFIFQAGGDLFAAGRPGTRDWKVGIQDPRGPRGEKRLYDLSLSDRAFNTSGDYERFVIKDGVRYHHILDARTGFPSHAARSVTILAPDAFTADTLDTAIFTMGPVAGMKLIEELPDVEGVIVGPDNQVHISSGLQDRDGGARGGLKLIKRGDPTPGL